MFQKQRGKKTSLTIKSNCLTKRNCPLSCNKKKLLNWPEISKNLVVYMNAHQKELRLHLLPYFLQDGNRFLPSPQVCFDSLCGRCPSCLASCSRHNRNHLHEKTTWTSSEGAPPHLRYPADSSTSRWCLIFRANTWDEMNRGTQVDPTYCLCRIQSKPAQLYFTLHPRSSLTVSPNFTPIHRALLAWMRRAVTA